MKRNKGFTLIELLVVIAIIGILSAIVLASLNTARNKAKDAAITAELASSRSQAELYYNTTGNLSYGPVHAVATACTAATDLFNDTVANNGLINLVAGITSNGGTPKCAAASASGNATSWAMSSPLVSNVALYACVDSTGASYTSGAKQAGITANVASCQ